MYLVTPSAKNIGGNNLYEIEKEGKGSALTQAELRILGSSQLRVYFASPSVFHQGGVVLDGNPCRQGLIGPIG